MSEEKFGLPWPDALNQSEDLIVEFLGIFQAIDHFMEFTVSTRLFPVPRYLEQREICLGFGQKYNIFSYLLLRQ